MKFPMWRRGQKKELEDEIKGHLEMATRERLERGETPEEARAAALRELGNAGVIAETTREMWGWTSLERLAHDVRYALRMLARSPGFTAVAILTLALGIGVNTAIFSYVNAWLIKPLPYPQSERLLVLLEHDKKTGSTDDGVTSTADFFDYEKQNTSFEHLAGWTSWYFNLTSDGPPDRVLGGLVSWNFFQALGVQPVLGRTFEPQEAKPGASHVAILSRGLWESRFAGDPRIIGRAIQLQGETYTVVGVMPGNYQFPLMGAANIWAPLALNEKERADRKTSWFKAFGRLKPGVTPEQAAGQLAEIASRLEKLYPQTNPNATTLLSPMTYEIGKNEGAQQVMISFWIVGLVLLIACANVANLTLARGARRKKEFAVRGALGASRARLIRQVLTESLVLFALGGGAGILFAAWGVRWIEDSIPDAVRGYLVNYGHAHLDLTTLVYTLGVALVCGVTFGLAPAIESSRLDVNRSLKESAGQASGSSRGARMRHALVAAEIALAVVVLISTTLLVESFAHMVYGGAGFNRENVVAAELVVPKTKYPTDAQVRTFYEQVMNRVRALPEVESAAASEFIPFGESSASQVIHVAGRPPAAPGEEIGAQYTAITPDYFSAMQIPLLRGRELTSADGEGAPRVVVINETLVKQQFPGEDPLGKQLEVGEHGSTCTCTIVGVVRNVKQFKLNDRPRRQIYIPWAQFPSPYMSIVARTSRPAPDLPNAIRSAVWQVDGEQPVSRVRTLEDMIAEQNTPNRLLTQMSGFFGLVALLLGAIGIYGVMAQSVERRTHEIGVRMALGARPDSVMRMVVGQGLRLTCTGIVLGLIAAAGATRTMAAILYQVNASDPLTFLGVAAFFSIVAVLACYIPARRAMRVDPMVALRYE